MFNRRHLLAGADLILVMTAEQRRMLDAYPEAAGKPVFTLHEFAGEAGDVDDPAGRGEDVFRTCREEIARCLERALPRLVGGADPDAPLPADTPVVSWDVVSSEAVYDCRLFSILHRRSRSPRTQNVHDVYLLEAPDWVNIVPLTADGRVVMIRQYRHGVEDITLEVPGGMLDSTDTEPAAAARREMVEETGFDSDVIEPLGATHPNPALQGNRCHTFVARDVVRRRAPEHHGAEHTEPVLVPLAEIPALILSGAISHALVIVAFHRLLLAGGR